MHSRAGRWGGLCRPEPYVTLAAIGCSAYLRSPRGLGVAAPELASGGIMSTKRLVGILAVCLVFLAAGIWYSQGHRSPATRSEGSLVAAAVLNLTGPAARFDAVKQQTLQLAAERVKEQYPAVDLEVQVLDGAGGPEATAVAVRRAVAANACCILSGTSPTALAIAAQVRGQEPTVAQLANAANPDFGPPRPGEYRFWPDWNQEAAIIFDLFVEKSLNTVLLVHSADPYSEALTASLTSKIESASRDIRILEFQFDPAATPDFRPALIRAKQTGTETIVVFGLPPGIRALISQLQEVNWEGTLIGGVNITLAVDDFVAAGLPGQLWAIQTEAMRDHLTPGTEAEAYRNAYQQRFGAAPPFHALYLADALYFIASAVSNPKTEGLPVVDRLAAVTSFDAPSGSITIQDDRSLIFDMALVRLR